MNRPVILYIAMSLDGYIAKDNDNIDFLSIVESPGEDYALIMSSANYRSDTISVIFQNSIINTINVDSPIGIEFNPTNRYLYVANYAAATVSVIDPTTNELVDTVSVGSYPFGVTYNPLNRALYVSNVASDTLSVISVEDPRACPTDDVQHWDKIVFMI